MLDLFSTIPNTAVGAVMPPAWDNVRDGLKRNLLTVQTYNRTYNKPVKSDHFLVRLLHSLAVPFGDEISRYAANVDAIAMGKAMVFKMHTSYYKGALFSGIFYGQNNPEIIIGVDEYFDPAEVTDNWQTVSAVRPLLHQKSDIDMMLPIGVNTSQENGLAVIAINIPMLAVQYRAFALKQMLLAPHERKTIMHFVGGFVLPNMLSAGLDISIFNRLHYLKFGSPYSSNKPFRNHPYALVDMDHRLDACLEITSSQIDDCNGLFNTVLSTIPAVSSRSMYPCLLMPDIAPTHQIDYILILARLRMVRFLLLTTKQSASRQNRAALNQILRSFRINNSYSMLRDNLPADLFFEVQNDIDLIVQTANVANL